MGFEIDIQGSGGDETQDGLQITRIGYGTPDAPHTASDIGIKMLEELNANGLAFNSPHPDFPNIFVWSRPFTAANDVVEFQIKYRAVTRQSPFRTTSPPPDNNQPATKSCGFASRRIKRTTAFDDSNNVIEATVSPPTEFAGSEAQKVEFEVFKTVGVIKFQREELTNPLDRLRAFKDTVNAFQEGPYLPGTLLFRPPTTDSDNNGQSWSVTYEFWWDEDGHGQEGTWTLQNKKQPPNHIDGVSRRVFVPYKRADYASLALDFND